MVAIVGEEALSEEDRRTLKFAEDFEEMFINQKNKNRDIEDTLDLGWELLTAYPDEDLKHLKPEMIAKYRK